MPKYRVKSPVQHDGKGYDPGSTISLSEEQAASMPWAVEPLAAEKPAAEEKPDKEKGGGGQKSDSKSKP